MPNTASLLKWLLALFLLIATIIPLSIPIEGLQFYVRIGGFGLAIVAMILLIRVPSEKPKFKLNLAVLVLLIATLVLTIIG